MGKDRYESPGVGSSDPGALAGFGFDTLPVVRVTLTDPATSERQRKLFGAALSRKRAGHPRPGDPDLGEEKLREFARKSARGYKQ